MYRIGSVKKSRNSTKSNRILSLPLPGGEKLRRIPNWRNLDRSRAEKGGRREEEIGEEIQNGGVKWERREGFEEGCTLNDQR